MSGAWGNGQQYFVRSGILRLLAVFVGLELCCCLSRGHRLQKEKLKRNVCIYMTISPQV